jgi:hypothetical protein
MLLNDLPEDKLHDSNTHEKNHNIKTCDTQNSVWLHNLFHVTFFVDNHSKYFLFGQKYCGLCMCVHARACVCLCVRSVTVINYDFCYQQLFFPCHWWQSVVWVSISLMWKIKQHFDISQNGTCSKKFCLLSLILIKYCHMHYILKRSLR